jgi:motility quorum-sensing regulator/GCU-specific mRNA interferase toxin
LTPIWCQYPPTEKRRPTYDLDAIKAAIGSADTLAITRSAFSDALSLGFNRAGVAKVVQGIQRSMFYKSMTTLADYRTWQDVYHVPEDDVVLYVKFQADVVTEFRVMSFKER